MKKLSRPDLDQLADYWWRGEHGPKEQVFQPKADEFLRDVGEKDPSKLFLWEACPKGQLRKTTARVKWLLEGNTPVTQGDLAALECLHQYRIGLFRQILAEHQAQKIDGTLVDAYSASAVVAVYDKLNDENRKKLISMHAYQAVMVAFKLINKKAA